MVDPTVKANVLNSDVTKKPMPYVMVDVESDGPIPGDYSMIAFGAVIVDSTLARKFASRLKPISDRWIPEALAVSRYSREETLRFEEPKSAMSGFRAWLKIGRASCRERVWTVV